MQHITKIHIGGNGVPYMNLFEYGGEQGTLTNFIRIRGRIGYLNPPNREKGPIIFENCRRTVKNLVKGESLAPR